MVDNYRHQGLRQQLTKELLKKGIKDSKVLQAIATIPRHLFLDGAFAEWAYKDVPFPIDSEQTISQPYTVALQSSLLEIKPTDKILEIGTGSGYQACVLAMLAAKVYTIERQEALYHKTSMLLPKLGFTRIRTLFGDGYLGSERFASFDKILVTAGANHIPDKLLSQLKVGGYLVIPLEVKKHQRMIRITKRSEVDYYHEDFGECSFVPFLSGVNKLKLKATF